MYVLYMYIIMCIYTSMYINFSNMKSDVLGVLKKQMSEFHLLHKKREYNFQPSRKFL